MEKRRFLAVVMTILMIISMVPSMVFAAAPSGELGGKLKIKGLAAIGVTVSADYSKVIPEGVTDENFTFSWSRQTGEKELTQVGTEKTYTITQDDLGYKLVLDITPVDGNGLTGTLTAKTLEVAATEEEAKAAADQNTDGTKDAQLEEDTDETGDSQDSADQNVDESQKTDETQDIENIQETETQDTEGRLEETQTADDNESVQQTDGSQENASDETYNEDSSEGTDDSQMKIYTEDQLQMDENGNVQTDGSDENEKAADEGKKKAYEASATVDNSEEPVCDFGSVKGNSEDVDAQYIQITNTGSETLNFQEISPDHFMVADITEPLAAGESVSVWVQPREGLEAGEYDDMIT